jgi:hypothetical protein
MSKMRQTVNFGLSAPQKRAAFLGGFVLPVAAGGVIGTKIGMDRMEAVPDDMSLSPEDRQKAKQSRRIAGGYVGGNVGVVGGVAASLAGLNIAEKAGLRQYM